MGLGTDVLQIFGEEQNQKIVSFWNYRVKDSFFRDFFNLTASFDYAFVTGDDFRRGISKRHSEKRIKETRELAETIMRTRHALLTTTQGVSYVQGETEIRDGKEVPSRLNHTYRFEDKGVIYHLINGLLVKPRGIIEDRINIGFVGEMSYDKVMSVFGGLYVKPIKGEEPLTLIRLGEDLSATGEGLSSLLKFSKSNLLLETSVDEINPLTYKIETTIGPYVSQEGVRVQGKAYNLTPKQLIEMKLF